MLAVLQDTSGETAEQKAQRLLLRLTICEPNPDHWLNPGSYARCHSFHSCLILESELLRLLEHPSLASPVSCDCRPPREPVEPLSLGHPFVSTLVSHMPDPRAHDRGQDKADEDTDDRNSGNLINKDRGQH